VREALADCLDASRLHAPLVADLTVKDVRPLTQIINGFIAQPWSDDDIKDWFREDAEIRAYQDAIDSVGKLVQRILNKLEPRAQARDRDRYHDALDCFWQMLAKMEELRPLLGKPRFKPHLEGKHLAGRSFMGLRIADEVLFVLHRIADRCGVPRQRGFGDDHESPILVFTRAMLKLISPGEEPPSERVLARNMARAKVSFQGPPD
jgi:hypothetical protein